jgi:tetratricopeptide (TPR) repeat protein
MFGCSNTYRDHAKLSEQPSGNTQVAQNKALAEKHLNDALFKKIQVNDATVFSLSPKQTEEFNEFYNNPRYAHLPEQKRFSEFLITRLANFTYDGQTFNAAEAFETMSGNCLSLAILTTALANHAGLDIRYQRVDARPIYEKHSNILLLSTHVTTRVYGPQPDNEEGVIFTIRPYVTIDYFPSDGDVRGETLSHDDFLAMYHRNMAAQSLIEHDYDTSYAYIKKGLGYEADHSETFNLLAVLYNKKYRINDELKKNEASHGQNAAMALYNDLIEQNNTSLNAIENYAALLKQTEQPALAQKYMSKLEGVNDNNPYQWLRIANEHYEQGDFRLAQKYAERAVKHGPYLHEPQFLLAKVYFEMRQYGASRRALLAAQEMSKSAEHERRYLAKLNALSN